MTKPQELVKRQLPNVLELGVQTKGERSTSGPDSDINTNPDPIDISIEDPYFEIASDQMHRYIEIY
jgi:hypothetical protein